MIDLHCHSYYSDGALSPKELIEKALKHEVRYLALTDHDTIIGISELQEAARGTSIQIIPGIEVSTHWKKYDIHILGYGMNHTPEFLNLIAQQSRNRIVRAQHIGILLKSIGITNAYDKACAIAGHERVGRPHFARVIVNEGKARDIQSAFKQFLLRGRTAFVPSSWVSVKEAVGAIVEAGGSAVIAHPLKYKLTRSKLQELIIEFIDAGGEGMEVISGEMTLEKIREMAVLCDKYHLLASSGSDYHSDVSSRIGLGRQLSLPVRCTPIWQKWTQ
jgi:3',5'-nucleoside bisphosphate phosphatase